MSVYIILTMQIGQCFKQTQISQEKNATVGNIKYQDFIENSTAIYNHSKTQKMCPSDRITMHQQTSTVNKYSMYAHSSICCMCIKTNFICKNLSIHLDLCLWCSCNHSQLTDLSNYGKHVYQSIELKLVNIHISISNNDKGRLTQLKQILLPNSITRKK